MAQHTAIKSGPAAASAFITSPALEATLVRNTVRNKQLTIRITEYIMPTTHYVKRGFLRRHDVTTPHAAKQSDTKNSTLSSQPTASKAIDPVTKDFMKPTATIPPTMDSIKSTLQSSVWPTIEGIQETAN